MSCDLWNSDTVWSNVTFSMLSDVASEDGIFMIWCLLAKFWIKPVYARRGVNVVESFWRMKPPTLHSTPQWSASQFADDCTGLRLIPPPRILISHRRSDAAMCTDPVFCAITPANSRCPMCAYTHNSGVHKGSAGLKTLILVCMKIMTGLAGTCVIFICLHVCQIVYEFG